MQNRKLSKKIFKINALTVLVAAVFLLASHARASFHSAPSQQTLSAYEKEIKIRREEVLKNLILSELYKRNEARISGDKISKEDQAQAKEAALESSVIQVFDLILSNIQKLKSLNESDAQFKILARDISLLDEATKSEGDRLNSVEVRDQLRYRFKRWAVKKVIVSQAEAKNLINPSTGRFYSVGDLAQLGDISKLDPPSRTSFWTKRDISKVNVTQEYLAGKNHLYSDLEVYFPQDNAVELDYMIFSQSKPKIAVYAFNESGQKVKYKLKAALETHADPTVSALSTALGFYNDVTKHVANLKVRLGKTSFEKLKMDYNKYYSRYKFESLLLPTANGSYVHNDSKGSYVVFKQASLEPKIKGILRAGPWAWGKNDTPYLREARGLLLFNIWIANGDLKEAENNELLVKSKGDSYELFRIQHDLGASLGKLILENVNDYPAKLIKSSKNEKEVEFNFFSVQENSGFKTVTYSDMKWMARLIAQLTSEQIKEAVKLGGWPEDVGALLFEKLKLRRNQIVKAFELDQEGFTDLPVNPKLTTSNGVIVNGKLKQESFEGFPQDFDMGILEFAAPELKKVGHGIVRLGTRLLSNTNKIKISGKDLESGLFTSVLLGARRDIEKNPNAQNLDESYIVKDQVEIGFELSPNVYVGVGGRVLWTYTLLYTAPDSNSAQYSGNSVLDLLLPVKARTGKLPEKYILITENSIAGKGFLRSDLYGSLEPIGMQISDSEILLGRTIVSNKDGKTLRFYKDRSLFNEIEAKIYARLAVLKIPLMSATRSSGDLNRKILEVSSSRINEPRMREAVTAAVARGDFDLLSTLVPTKSIDSKFAQQVSKFNLLLFGSKNEFRVDEIEEQDLPIKGDRKKQNLMFRMFGRSSRSSHWAAIDNGESVGSKVILTSLPSQSAEEIREPVIHLHYTNVDNNTKSRELSKGYIDFANQITNDASFVSFTPEAQSSNNLWGKMNIVVNVVYHPEAVRALLNLDLEEFRRRVKADPVVAQDSIGRHRAKAFINRIEAAQSTQSQVKQMKELIKALRVVTWKKALLSTELNGRLLGIINAMVLEKVGLKKMYFNALGANDGSHENKMPGRMALYGVKGKSIERPESLVLMSDGDPLELYEAL